MSDRLDRGSGRWRPWALAALAVAAAALGAGCNPHDPGVLPPDPPPPVPCTREVAVATDSVVIAAGACNPGCIHVPVGTPVYFLNGDPSLYLFASTPALPFEVQVPGRAGAVTPGLTPAGAYVFSAVNWPAATVTVFVE